MVTDGRHRFASQWRYLIRIASGNIRFADKLFEEPKVSCTTLPIDRFLFEYEEIRIDSECPPLIVTCPQTLVYKGCYYHRREVKFSEFLMFILTTLTRTRTLLCQYPDRPR